MGAAEGSHGGGRLFDGISNARICAAAADIARHGLFDVFVRRIAVRYQKRRRLHKLTGLTISALRYLEAQSKLAGVDAGRSHPDLRW
jgi:hypothetical protein